MNLSSLIHFAPDSLGYINYADIIIKSRDWLDKVDVSSIDATLHRMPLYPLLIALFKVLCGNGWSYALVLFQLAVLFFSALLVYKLCAYLEFKKINISIALVGYLTGLPLLFSFFILTDGLYTSFGISVICTLCLRIANNKHLTNNIILLFCLLFMSLLRESTLYFAITLLPIMSINFFLKEHKKGIATLLICFLPVIAAQESMKQWNNHRCGSRIITSGTTTALVAPQLDLINNQPLALDCSSIKNYLPKSRLLTFTDGISAILNKMKVEKLNILEIQSIVEGDYYRSFALFPKEQIFIAINRISRDIIFVQFNPFYTIAELLDPTGTKLPRLSKIQACFQDNIDFRGLAFIFMLNGLRLFSLLLCLWGFYKLAKRIICRNFNIQTLLMGGILLHALGWIFVYSLVHMEIRYIATSVVMFLLLGCAPSRSFVRKPPYTIFKKWINLQHRCKNLFYLNAL